MNGIIGFSELLKELNLPDDKRKYYAGIVIDSSKQLLTIVNDILDISLIETGKVSLSYEEVVVNDLIDILFAFFEPQAKGKTIELISSNPLNNKSSTIQTDKIRIRQVMTNLLNNAIKFTHEGHIKFGYKKVAGYLEFFVEDTGIGIAEICRRRYLNHFVRLNLKSRTNMGEPDSALQSRVSLLNY